MNLHTLPRTFYLTRHGQSEYNLLGKIGGDSGLTPAGIEYARRLSKFAKSHIARGGSEKDYIDTTNEEKKNDTIPEDQGVAAAGGGTEKEESKANGTNGVTEDDRKERPCRLWTSTLRRTRETAQFIEHNSFEHTWDNGETGEWVQFRPMRRRNLDELYAGICDGMTYKEIEQVYPEEFTRRQQDKLAYRYPRGKRVCFCTVTLRIVMVLFIQNCFFLNIFIHLFLSLFIYFPIYLTGESYMDVTLRLEPLAQEMERTREPVLIVGHQGILRILYAYFMGLDRKEAPYVSIPLNNVIELTPHAYGCHETRYCLMMKEEMLNDGQDEPVTSMPVASKHTMNNGTGGSNGGSSSNGTTGTATNGTRDGTDSGTTDVHAKRQSVVEKVNTEYSPTDPIMNAPSC